MKTILFTSICILLLSACSKEDLPTTQAKHAIDAANHVADQAAEHAQDMADKANSMLEGIE